MTETDTSPPLLHTLPDGRRMAYRHSEGRGPTLVFLPGYMSDMLGGKASALMHWAREQGRACLLLDYTGCGVSDGTFADGTLSAWRDEIVSLLVAKVDGKIVLFGSSMGGWLMLLLGLALKDRLAGLVGIAPAPDFSEWGYLPEQKDRLRAGESVFEDNPYGPEPTPTHAKFWRDAQDNRLLDKEIALDCPVHLIHGQRDADVPWQISLRLADALHSDEVQVTLIKDGDHRLSRPQDIAALLRVAQALTDRIEDSATQ
ncbi:alpha/beta fold hydrolase [Altererythrobacter aurantiacus]|uniref:Palmitoyl-protein thioesterase ABHD10, mitochondrial n=1 Tax=Parapontixanthobacter aurantiacus TaxID=1463599 RepID=A0A844ZFI3_9SPHN|nr:alpha/beta hydrolase [Parapontixanthobacter aurantiacus]MXO86083.1 alpha/beta fold hydrolase [Parapontixanthobacter aurantiacus]